jgi:Tfp pilus assembly protein PilF
VLRTSLSRLPFFTCAVILAGILSGCVNGNPTEIISYNRQNRETGMELYGKSQWAEAASAFNAALRQEPGDYTSRFYLGACEEQMGKQQQAIQQYWTTLTVMDHSLEGKTDVKFRKKVTWQLAQTIARQGDRSGDLTALEQKPRTLENTFMLARIYRQIGDADSAIASFEKAQKLDPRDPDVAKEYGLYLEQLGQTQRADSQLRRAYALNSKDEEVSAALRRLGVVPGPSLKGEDGLEKPFVPLGPIPELDVTTSNKSNTTPATGAQTTTPGPVGSTSPRD